MLKPELNQTHADRTRFEWHGENGPVIVLIHGLGLNRHMWQWQLEALSKNYRVLTYDLLAHGETPRPTNQQSLKLFARQLYQLLNELEIDRCHVVGFSLGGMIARRFAMDYPDKLDALVILNSPHARDAVQQQAIVKRVDQVADQGPGATVDAAIERWFTEEFRLANGSIIDLVRQWVLANDIETYPDSYRVLAMGVEELVAPDPAISSPTLVITAEDDYGQPASMAHAIAAEIPDAQVKVVPKLRHMALVEAPEVFNNLLIEFFNKTKDPRTAERDVQCQ